MSFRTNGLRLTLALAIFASSFSSISSVAAAGSGATLAAVAPQLSASVVAASAGDWASARLAYHAFDDAWDAIRDDVLVNSPTAYSTIEDSAEVVELVLGSAGTPADAAAGVAALTAHRDLIAAQAASLG